MSSQNIQEQAGDDKKKFLDESLHMISLKSTSHCEDVLNRIKLVVDTILKYLDNESLKIDLAKRSELFLEGVRIKLFGIDKIINPSKKNYEHDLDNTTPIISIYNSLQEPIFLNIPYLKSIGFNSFKEVYDLYKKGTLYNEIYTDESLEKIKQKTTKIEETGGYVDEIFETRITKKRLKFNTIYNNILKCSVRTAEDITDLGIFADFIIKNSLEEPTGLKFNALNDWQHYKKLIRDIIINSKKSNQIIEHYLEKEENLNKLITYIDFMLCIGDYIVDRGPYLIYFFDGENHFYNKRYIQAANYDYSSFKELFDNGSVVDALYGYGNELNNVLTKVASLSPGGLYNAIFTMRRKDLTYIDVSWSSYGYKMEKSSFRIGKIVSPIHLLDFLLSVRDLKKVY